MQTCKKPAKIFLEYAKCISMLNLNMRIICMICAKNMQRIWDPIELDLKILTIPYSAYSAYVCTPVSWCKWWEIMEILAKGSISELWPNLPLSYMPPLNGPHGWYLTKIPTFRFPTLGGRGQQRLKPPSWSGNCSRLGPRHSACIVNINRTGCCSIWHALGAWSWWGSSMLDGWKQQASTYRTVSPEFKTHVSGSATGGHGLHGTLE